MQSQLVLLGVTGGIAAYKTPELVRSLKRRGYEVEAVMTESAREFVTPLVLREVSGRPVHIGLFDPVPDWNVQHVSLAQKADVVAVVPATANLIGKMAAGIADDLLTSVLLATRSPILLAPAMNSGMYRNSAVQHNLKLLKERGVHIVGPAEGELLCGQAGEGRLSDLGEIQEAIVRLLTPQDLKGLRVLVTAGPTQEPWDPVRFISNPSSGKMGYALAQTARRRGAEVCLVSGPTELPPVNGVEHVSVRTALDMFQAVMERYKQFDVAVMAAAPTDYRPAERLGEKQKRTGGNVTIELVENPDIARAVGRDKGGLFLVVFAAETSDMKANAREKLLIKNADLVVANDLTIEEAGFRKDTNRASLISREEELDLPAMTKERLADLIWNAVLTLRKGGRLSEIGHE